MKHNKRYIVLFFLSLLMLNSSFADQSLYGLDDLKFNFKLYFNSILHSKNLDNKAIDFKKSKLGFSYSINEKSNFYISFLYSKRNDFEFDCEYFDYNIDNDSILSIGNIRTVFDMYSSKSENHLSILVPVINKATGFFIKAKGIGLSYKTYYNNNFGFHASLVGKNINDSDDDSSMFSVRNFYFSENDSKLFHIGLNGNFIKNKVNNKKVKHVGNIFRNFSINKSAAIGIEIAEKIKNFTVESGIFCTRINPMLGVSNNKYFNVYNFYYEMNYIITGENRRYSYMDGAIKGIKVGKPITESGIGAIELVGRYQFTDAISSNNTYKIDMGRHNIFITGINWLPTNNCKILFNYINTNSVYKLTKTLRNNEFKIEYRLFI